MLRKIILIQLLILYLGEFALGQKDLNPTPLNTRECQVPFSTRWQIRNYKSVVNEIKRKVQESAGQTYRDTLKFVDTYGARMAGSPSLEKSIDYLDGLLQQEAIPVGSESVDVFYWQRNFESADLLEPEKKPFSVLAYTPSVPTPPEGITATILRVSSYDELNQRASDAPGKIVFLDFPFDSYFSTYYSAAVDSAIRVSQVGGLAALVGSLTDFSLYSPHTTWANYSSSVPKIPVFSMTLEDAAYLQRMDENGESMRIRLFSNSTYTPNLKSRNLFGELRGNGKTSETIMISAHTDTWDISPGAQDDGVGVLLTLNALRILKSLSSKPRRNIQVALWTAEENYLYGAKAYYMEEAKQLKNLRAALESDVGCLRSHGWVFGDLRENSQFGCILYEIGKLIGMDQYSQESGYLDTNFDKDTTLKLATDVMVLGQAQLPFAILNGDGTGRYFWYHHSAADTALTLNSTAIDDCLVLYAATTYVLADMNTSF